LDWETLIFEGMEARQTNDKCQWRLGDLALQVEVLYGDRSLQEYASKIGISYASLKVYRWVASQYELVTRVTNCSWAHHRAVAGRPDRLALLQIANDEGLSAKALEVKARLPEPVSSVWAESMAQWEETEDEMREVHSRKVQLRQWIERHILSLPEEAAVVRELWRWPGCGRDSWDEFWEIVEDRGLDDLRESLEYVYAIIDANKETERKLL
jgi:hypothetical protein